LQEDYFVKEIMPNYQYFDKKMENSPVDSDAAKSTSGQSRTAGARPAGARGRALS
jgi:hypothetical protein